MAASLLELFLQDLISDNDLDPSIPVDFDIVNEHARVRSEASQGHSSVDMFKKGAEMSGGIDGKDR
jgi:hypothetical protein